MAQSIVTKIGKGVVRNLGNRVASKTANSLLNLVGLGTKTVKKFKPHELQAIIDSHSADYSLNILNGVQYYKDEPFTDLTLIRLRNELSAEYDTVFAETNIKKAAQLACHSKPFHPVRRHLEGLPKWDRTNRIPALFDLMKIKVENDEHRKLMEKALLCFLTAGVARVMKPGCQCDSMLILKGPTGCRKSTFLKALAINDEWFSSALLNITEKDGLQIIAKYWLFECAELHALLRKPANAVKEFITRTRDDWRAPYARTVEAHERQILFVGSTNQEKFITDPLSNRRFWVLEIGDVIDTDAFLQIREQLWAQAYAEYLYGTPWHLAHADEEAMSAKVAAYQV